MRHLQVGGFLMMAALVAFCGGCQYLENRGNDFLDPFKLHVGIGPGMGGNVAVFRGVQAGLSWETYSVHAGILGRDVGVWNEKRYDVNLVVPFIGVTDRQFITAHKEREDYTRRLDPPDPRNAPAALRDPERRFGEVAASAQLIMISAEVGFDLIEFADFFGGIGEADFLEDDDAGIAPTQAPDAETKNEKTEAH